MMFLLIRSEGKMPAKCPRLQSGQIGHVRARL
jgi:hypothetical protein